MEPEPHKTLVTLFQKHFFWTSGPFIAFLQKYFPGNPLPQGGVFSVFLVFLSWNFHKSTLTFLHKIQAKMHFQKCWQVSEPFSLFCGVQGVFQVDFEAIAVSCDIRPANQSRSQPTTVMATILKRVKKSGKIGEKRPFQPVESVF